MPTTQRAREKPSTYEIAKALIAEIEARRGEFLYNVHNQSLIMVSGKRLWSIARELGLPWSPPVLHLFLAEAQLRGWRLVGTIARGRRGRSRIWLFELPPQSPPNQWAGASEAGARSRGS